jgi:hypothetical protein
MNSWKKMWITVHYLDYLPPVDKSDMKVMPIDAEDVVHGLSWFHKQNLDID